jgi:hypothetical protein
MPQTRLIALFLAGIGYCVSGLAAGADSQAVTDYQTGTLVGLCVAGQCQIFSGSLPNELPKPGHRITIRVQEWLFGGPDARKSVEIPYDDYRSPAGDGYTAQAWLGAPAAPNQQVIVVFANQQVWLVHADQPAIVTGREHDGDVIRSLVPHALRLLNHPEFATDEVASLSKDPSPGLAGFLFAYLTWQKNLKGEVAADLLQQMFGNPHVPPEVWADMPFWLEIAAGAQPAEKRAALTKRYLDLAQQPDIYAAQAGFAGLALVISDEKSSATITPDTRVALARIYRHWIEKGSMRRNASLEKSLGIE